ncbi:autotransporter outer membrane beta-barrel domain-containing protein [Pseudomonas fluorescens]|uniref:autotransporter outer membrane beta-barrel domain-containing protein n=1 Tax=Pseudomonas fluorescens TaxID=294 RepID=UPI001131A2D6|nr:autotransporter outer membrane beta-barrel domain-containing protein [Pseudomonas fluorescens]TMU73963.1 autotransporter outer membrane beta-barrel domain-containing protein [Pseudomonas fluorescens]
MNHIYRLVFNSSTGLCQVVSELGSKSQGSGAGTGIVLPQKSGLAMICLLALATASGSVWAAPGGAGFNGSGNGGATGVAGQAGTGVNAFGGAAGVAPGGNGGQGGQGSFGGGGGGGGGGASGTSTAPTGGNGGDAGSFGFAGGGGGGGDGFVTDSDTTNTLVATGGKGGGIGNGGGGGNGLTVSSAGHTVTNTNSGVLRGGNGGDGDSFAGGGGAGLSGAGLTVVNDGHIEGGKGGTAKVAAAARPGTGGAGITGATQVINSGSITGGLSGDATPVRANAIEFTGTANTLEVRKGSTIVGNVMGAAGASNTLALGGTVDDSFDTSQIGSAAQYRNFTDFQKIGTNTYTLTGTTTAVTPWSVLGGTLAISSDNNLGAPGGALTLNGGILQSTTSLSVGRAVTLGANGGTVNTAPSITTAMSGAISGAGALSKTGAGVLALSGANTYSGATHVAAGTLEANAFNTLSASSAHTVASGATLDTAGFNQSVAGLTNSGTVSLVGSAPGSTLTVTGPYVGQNGVLRLGTALSDSSGASDRLVLSGPGATASGQTALQVVNQQGLGALTAGDGITVVSALSGATTTAQTSKDAFSLAGGHVDAGAYEYRLYAADAKGAGENWYLRSSLAPTPAPGTTGIPGQPGKPTYRTEVPLLAGLPEQLRQGDLAMLGNLHQRFGANPNSGASSMADDKAPDQRHAWGRALGTDLSIAQHGTVNQSSSGHLSGFQTGTDLYADDSWRAGVFAGQLKGHQDVKGFARGVNHLSVGDNDLTSQYLGGYATWTDASGLYVDSVLQNGRHQYKAHSDDQKISGKADSWLASVEMGKPFALGGPWRIEPQVQLVHQHLSVDDEHLGSTRVSQDTQQQWLARLGTRLEGDFATGVGLLQPYTRVNLYRAANGTDRTRFASAQATTAIDSSTGYLSSELAGGATLKLNDSTDVYAEVGKQWAAGGDSDVSTAVQGSMGVRVKW